MRVAPRATLMRGVESRGGAVRGHQVNRPVTSLLQLADWDVRTVTLFPRQMDLVW